MTTNIALTSLKRKQIMSEVNLILTSTKKMLRAGLLSLALFFSCCSGDEHDATKYINIDAAIGSISPAGMKFATGDKMTLYAWTGSADAASANIVVDGVECTYGNDSRWTTASPMVWSGSDTPHYFMAFSPTE